MIHANLVALSFTEPELWSIEVYIAGIGILYVFGSRDLDLDQTTFIYELDSYCLELCATMNLYVKAFESYRPTDRHYTYGQTESTEIINHVSSRVLKCSLLWRNLASIRC